MFLTNQLGQALSPKSKLSCFFGQYVPFFRGALRAPEMLHITLFLAFPVELPQIFPDALRAPEGFLEKLF